MAFPRSLKDARARSRRKLKALEKKARKDLLDIAAYFDEGPVSTEIDITLDELETNLKNLNASINDEVERWDEWEKTYASS